MAIISRVDWDNEYVVLNHSYDGAGDEGRKVLYKDVPSLTRHIAYNLVCSRIDGDRDPEAICCAVDGDFKVANKDLSVFTQNLFVIMHQLSKETPELTAANHELSRSFLSAIDQEAGKEYIEIMDNEQSNGQAVFKASSMRSKCLRRFFFGGVDDSATPIKMSSKGLAPTKEMPVDEMSM